MRGAPRWLAVLAVAAIVAVVAGFTLRKTFTPAALLVERLPGSIPADGFAATTLKVHSSNGSDLTNLRAAVDDPARATVESVVVRDDTALVTLRSGVMPGTATVHFDAPGIPPAQVRLQTTLVATDRVGDGTPDFLRLHDAADRQAFRRWFTLLAESEYFRKNDLGEVDDCAALLRYSYREALRQHDAGWAKTVSLSVAPRAGEIRQYHYPYTPLGAGMFRVREGTFVAEDMGNGNFAQFADAKTLWRLNSYMLGRDLERAQPGDLLFFHQDGHDLPFHAMIYLGPSQVESSSEPLVVYHTGPDGASKGEIRRLTLTQLLNFPDPRWRPVPSNPSFLGVYRWNILRGTD